MAPGAPLAVDPDRPQDALHALSGPLSTPLDAFMRDAKRRAIEHLAGALGGDSLAAEYALLAILSRAYVRTEVGGWVRAAVVLGAGGAVPSAVCDARAVRDGGLGKTRGGVEVVAWVSLW